MAVCIVPTLLSACGSRPKTFSVSSPHPVRVVLLEASGPTARPVEPLVAADRAIALTLAWRAGQEQQWILAMVAGAVRKASSSPPEGAQPAASAPSIGCGGDLPPCYVKQRESGGDYAAVNSSGCGGESCGGAWQFAVSTWNDYGGYHYAQDAPPEVQDAKAREAWAGGAGCSHWAACG